MRRAGTQAYTLCGLHVITLRSATTYNGRSWQLQLLLKPWLTCKTRDCTHNKVPGYSALLTAQKNRAAFARGMLLGLRGTLPKLPTGRVDDLFNALPLGLAVGGVLTSAGGTGPPLAKYKFLLRANFTCTQLGSSVKDVLFGDAALSRQDWPGS